MWKLPASGVLEEDMTSPVATFTPESRASSASGVTFHPSADGVVAFYAQKELFVGDLTTQTLSFQSGQGAASDNVCSLAWSYDGSLLLTASLDKRVRLVDPRAAPTSSALETEAHTGRRPASVAWCGRLERFVSAGSDSMQERELKLWDPRHLAKAVHRQRLDASIGQLLPLYDDDVNLLFLLGRGDRSVRSFEVDATRAVVQPLDHSVLANMTFAAALVPKQACDTTSCEVARVLNLSTSSSTGGVCDVLSFRVPRKDAARTFQSDLYPDTKAFTAALTAAEWQAGQNAEPLLEHVRPSGGQGVSSAPARTTATTTASSSSGAKLSSWGSSSSTWTAPAGPPPVAGPVSTASSAQPPAPVAVGGWGSSSTAWGSSTTPAAAKPPTPAAPAWKATASVPSQLPQWQTAAPPAAAAWGGISTAEEAPATLEPNERESPDSLSDKALRLGSKYGHKVRRL